MTYSNIYALIITFWINIKPEKFYILIALAISDNQNVLNNQRSIIQAKTDILVQLKKNIISRRDHNQNKAKPKFVRLE